MDKAFPAPVLSSVLLWSVRYAGAATACTVCVQSVNRALPSRAVDEAY